MITRRIATGAAALFAASALALTGCAGGTNSAATKADEKIQLSMLVNITPNLTEKWWNELVVPFEKANPNIDVKIQAPSAEGVKKMLPQLLASGNLPDIVQTVPPSKELAPELVDLSKYEWAKKVPMADNYAIDGKYYMASVGYQLQAMMYYNKKAFADAGITEPPTTLEELDADLKKLKDAGWTPIQSSGDWASQYVAQAVGIPTVLAENPDWYKGIADGSLTYSGTYGKTIDLVAKWVKEGYIPKDQVGLKYPEAEQAFLAGKTAIYPMGAWFAAAEAKATSKPEIGVFPAPASESVQKRAQPGGAAGVYVLMKASKHQDAAAKLLEYLATDKEAVTAQLAVDGNFRSGYDYKMTPLQAELQKIVNDTPADDYVPFGDGVGQESTAPGFATELNKQVQALFTGGSADAAKSAMDAWFKANKKK